VIIKLKILNTASSERDEGRQQLLDPTVNLNRR